MLIYKTHRIEFNDFESMEVLFPDSTFFKGVKSFLKAWDNAQKEDFTFRTSGSTGRPKEITHSRASIIKSVKKTRDYFDLKDGDAALLAMPVAFVAGRMMMARALVLNLDLYLAEPSLNPLKEYDGQAFEFVPLTPLQLEHVLEHNPISIRGIKTILLGGAPVKDELMDRIQTLSNQVFIGYGMTETLTHIAARALNGPDASELYTVLKGIKIDQKEGCLVINADHIEGLVYTNDLVEIVNPTQFKWIGRNDLIINSGGLKINPEELEKSLKLEFDFSCVFIGIPDQQLGEKLVLIIEENQANTTFDEVKVKRFIESGFSKYHVPKLVHVMNEIPMTPTGKTDRNKLRIYFEEISGTN